ncbi:DUF4133 domain-containing protein [Elizabethkingia anophelis]|uniref:DUF4133 domain-containing protein n=1 Tax=Elizabethkingia anophelis TaxID=1117645 RepID=UPI0020114388|nr:DUF4133 domain-containing protein [Elizabethkingia anophelis]EJC8060221.1 DUF4133 domain-containing protein [Elizabethkingia anophelis]MCL1643098.1 DUF4133 domain-containing protein [Elizabethkingia anophelis]MCL1643779.1 DUF4133 domain-containing protein [Elizabethkingia anophelis]MCT4032822.1 DUF4133 domain-containing protein [Elizabethkingia anophelis]MDV3781419.1 conjugal transfer protein TraF [Elizabethkingia anophelis]
MNTYHINKGIGRKAEFKGLKAQYLMAFAIGLLLLLILVMIMYMAGVHVYICLSFGLVVGCLIIWQTFSLNRKYGEYGLMKLRAKKKHPDYIISRRSVRRLIRVNSKNVSV